MLIFLPPSEGKAASGTGAPVDLAGLSLPELAPVRRAVGDALVRLCRADRAKAMAVLKLGPKLAGEVDRNAALWEAPAVPAAELYTGVLYDALGFGTLAPGARRLADESVRIFSGLWGMVSPADRIPPYRCSMGVILPKIGAVNTYWRLRPGPSTGLHVLLGDQVLLDLRSGAYAGVWKPHRDIAEQVVSVRVLHERVVNGELERSVVSHFNKATKGRIVRDLLTADVRPRKASELLDALRDLGYRVEGDGPGTADVVVAEV